MMNSPARYDTTATLSISDQPRDEGGTMEWVDSNLGSKVTMKYPACYLMEPGAHGEILSMAFAGKGQIQDTGGKMLHLAADTSSKITSKSISKDGG